MVSLEWFIKEKQLHAMRQKQIVYILGGWEGKDKEHFLTIKQEVKKTKKTKMIWNSRGSIPKAIQLLRVTGKRKQRKYRKNFIKYKKENHSLSWKEVSL